MILLAIITFVVFISISHHTTLERGINELLDYFATVSGAPVKIRYCIAIYCMAFILSQLYVNGLTSVVTVATPPKGFKNVKELVHNGYIISFVQDNLPPQEIFDEEFKAFGVTVEEAFQVFGRYTTHDQVLSITVKTV